MPSHVRIFWYLSVAIVTYWVLSTAWFLAFPSAHHLATLAKLPPELREGTRRIDLQIAIVSTSVWCGATLGFAWLAAFRRQNLARWTFAALFLLRESIPLILAAAYHRLDDYFVQLAHADWTDPRGYITPALSIAAIGFVFSRDARDWFRRPAPAA